MLQLISEPATFGSTLALLDAETLVDGFADFNACCPHQRDARFFARRCWRRGGDAGPAADAQYK